MQVDADRDSRRKVIKLIGSIRGNQSISLDIGNNIPVKVNMLSVDRLCYEIVVKRVS